MDFSRALWSGGFPDKPCASIVQTGNTSTTINVLKSMGAWDAQRAKTVAASLLSIDQDTILAWVNDMPPTWVTGNIAGLAGWWQSKARNDRIDELLKLI